ncbi:MAG: hypothetical protein MZU84_01540 [Sphingobacterium sp.]|nr:hypothetical protein [Sphingobacterium sp.]
MAGTDSPALQRSFTFYYQPEIFNADFMPAQVDHGANNGPDHIMQETVCGDPEGKPVFILFPFCIENRA